MKFLALLRKEFREVLPWLLLAAIAFGCMGGFVLESRIRQFARYPASWHFGSGRDLSTSSMIVTSHLSQVGVILLMASAALGIALGARQYWLPGFTRTWAFELHRSTSRRTILLAKVVAAGFAMAVGLGLVWTLLFLYASRPGAMPYPPRLRHLAEGWVYVLLGLLVYFAVGVAGLVWAYLAAALASPLVAVVRVCALYLHQ